MDEQSFEDYYNLGEVKTEEELKESCRHSDRIGKRLIAMVIFAILAASSLMLQKKLHIPDLVTYILLWCAAVSMVVFAIKEVCNDISNEVFLASRDQITELVKNVREFPQIERLFCAYMKKRNYLTEDEYNRFVMTIKREKEQQAEIEFNAAIQSICQENAQLERSHG